MAFVDESLYAVIGIPVIFILGFVGALTPSILARIFPNYGLTKKLYFSFFNGLAGGLILAVGFIHSLPDSFGALGNVLTDGSMTDNYPWPAFITLMAIIILFTAEEVLDVVSSRFGIESFDAHSHGGAGPSHGGHEDHACDHTIEEHKALDGQCDAQPLEELCTHGHSHSHDASNSSSDSETDLEAGGKKGEEEGGSISTADKTEKKEEEKEEDVGPQPTALELFTKMLVLFIGLFFHNVFVGLALGIADNDYVLFIAILFHQFFEGVGMGSRVAMAKLKRVATVLVVDFLFALAPVVFIGIGIGVKQVVANTDSSDGYNITKGTFQGLSAGMLIYVALVHMMRGYKDLGATGRRLDYHRLSSYFGLLVGAAIMSVIGIWA